MNCAHCEERMSDYLENALDPAERASLDLHLQSCSDCAELFADAADVMTWGRNFPVVEAPSWLPARIVANTPRVVRETWLDLFGAAWRTMFEPRLAMGVLTTTLFLGWLGSWAGISPDLGMIVRNPSAVVYQTENLATRAYDHAIQGYYRSSLVIQIQSQIQYRLDQIDQLGPFRETS